MKNMLFVGLIALLSWMNAVSMSSYELVNMAHISVDLYGEEHGKIEIDPMHKPSAAMACSTGPFHFAKGDANFRVYAAPRSRTACKVIPEEYRFDQRIDLRINEYDKKGKLEERMDITMLLSSTENYIGMLVTLEGVDSKIVFDMPSKQMITFVNVQGQKMAMAMAFDPQKFEMDDENTDDLDIPRFTATGKEKNIAGYLSKEYKLEESTNDGNQEVYFWISSETEVSWMQAFAGMYNSNPTLGGNPMALTDFPEGALMEMSQIDAKGKKTEFTVLKIAEQTDERIRSEGYNMMNMGSFGR